MTEAEVEGLERIFDKRVVDIIEVDIVFKVDEVKGELDMICLRYQLRILIYCLIKLST